MKYSLKQKYLLDMKIKMNKIKCFFFISVSLEVYRNCIYVDLNGLDTAPHRKFIVDIYLRDKCIFLSSINSTCLQKIRTALKNRLLLMDTAFFFKVMRWSLGWQFLKPWLLLHILNENCLAQQNMGIRLILVNDTLTTAFSIQDKRKFW